MTDRGQAGAGAADGQYSHVRDPQRGAPDRLPPGGASRVRCGPASGSPPRSFAGSSRARSPPWLGSSTDHLSKEAPDVSENLNVVVITGNLTRDPELRHTGGGTPVCDMRVAVDARRENQWGKWGGKPNFFGVMIWGAQAELRQLPDEGPAGGGRRPPATGASGRPRTAAASDRRCRSSPPQSSSSAPAGARKTRRTAAPSSPTRRTSRARASAAKTSTSPF